MYTWVRLNHFQKIYIDSLYRHQAAINKLIYTALNLTYRETECNC